MFSVIVPTHNSTRQLGNVLAGLVAQRDAPPLEVLLVDNNSWRESPDAVYRRYVDRLDLTLVRQPRLPHPFALCRARNLGLKLARYPWVICLDADCIPSPGHLAALAAHLSGSPDCMVAGERIFIHSTGLSEQAIVDEPGYLASRPIIRSAANYGCRRDRRFPDLEALSDCPHPWALMHGGNLAFSRDAAVQIGGFDEAYDGSWGYEDVDFAWRLIRSGVQPTYAPGAEAYHQECEGEQPRRADKRSNPNWHRIVATIPGFADFKARQYSRVGARVVL